MKIELFLKSRSGAFSATATYEDRHILVKKGSLVNKNFADHIRGGRKAKSYLNDKQFVDEYGYVIKDCLFNSPSTAAQFVTGCSRNGYLVWKTEDGRKLKDIIKRESEEVAP